MIKMNKTAVGAGFLLLLFLATVFLCYRFGVENLTPASVRELVLSYGWYGPVVYVALYAVRPLVFFPAIVFTLAGPLAFGPWWGTVYVVLGASLGAFLCFALARRYGQERFRQFAGDRFDIPALRDIGPGQGFRTMLFMRVVPLFHFDVVSYGAGLSGIGFGEYAAATVLGIIPGAAIYNFLGYSVLELLSPAVLAAVVLVAVLVATPFIYRMVAKR